MDDQPDLFEGARLKEAGIAKVLSHNETYAEAFETSAKMLLDLKGTITSENIIEVIGMPAGHVNAIGASMRKFAARNHLSIIGYTKAKRPSGHARRVAIWGRRTL